MYLVIDVDVPNPIITVDLEAVLKDSTLDVLTNYTRGITETQKFALQTLLDGIEANNLNQYITNLYLHLLAGDENEVMYNIKTGVNDQPSVNKTYWELGPNGGIRAINLNETIASGDKLLIPFGGNGPSTLNYHMIMGHLADLPDLSVTRPKLFGDASSPDGQRFFGDMKDANNIEIKHSSSGNGFYFGANGGLITTPCVQGIMSDTKSKKAVNSVGEVFNANVNNAVIPYSADVPFTLNNRSYLVDYNSSTGAHQTEMGILSLGSAMPEALFATYQNLLSVFLGNFLP